jgi:hypothetical protein
MNMGDLRRRFERDGAFVPEFSAGPGATPSGTVNGDLSLRFGTYRGKKRPREVRVGRVKLFWGKDAWEWVRLSTFECRPGLSLGYLSIATTRTNK